MTIDASEKKKNIKSLKISKFQEMLASNIDHRNF